jgi:hypothetical protein
MLKMPYLRICSALAASVLCALPSARGAASPGGIDFFDPSTKFVVGDIPLRSLADKVAVCKVVARITILEVTPPPKATRASAGPAVFPLSSSHVSPRSQLAMDQLLANVGLESAVCRARVEEVFKGPKKLSAIVFRLAPILGRHDLDHLVGESFIAFLHTPPSSSSSQYWLLGGRDEGLFSTHSKTFEEWRIEGRKIVGEKYDYAQYVGAICHAAGTD